MVGWLERCKGRLFNLVVIQVARGFAVGIPSGESGNPYYLKYLDSRFHGNDTKKPTYDTTSFL